MINLFKLGESTAYIDPRYLRNWYILIGFDSLDGYKLGAFLELSIEWSIV